VREADVFAGSGDGKTPIAPDTSVEVTTSGKSAVAVQSVRVVDVGVRAARYA
jgi:hypothetical protein